VDDGGGNDWNANAQADASIFGISLTPNAVQEFTYHFAVQNTTGYWGETNNATIQVDWDPPELNDQTTETQVVKNNPVNLWCQVIPGDNAIANVSINYSGAGIGPASVLAVQDDGDANDWNGNFAPDSSLYGISLTPTTDGLLAYNFSAVDTINYWGESEPKEIMVYTAGGGGGGDTIPPVISSATAKPTSALVSGFGGQIWINATVTDGATGVNFTRVNFVNTSSTARVEQMPNIGGDTYQYIITGADMALSGYLEWYVFAEDNDGNSIQTDSSTVAVYNPTSQSAYIVGESNYYLSIQGAIDNANPSDTIVVNNGTYNERLLIDKTLNLTGWNRDTTIIDGGGSGNVIDANNYVHWVNISGFTIQNSMIGSSGIKLFQNDNWRIESNNFTDNWWGIIVTDSNYNIIKNNDFYSNDDYGLRLSGGAGGEYYHRVYQNNFINNSKHAYCAYTPNQWNLSAAIGGNYWDNWTSPDTLSGPSQDQPGADGFVDNPYPWIGGGTNFDYYPFVDKNGWDVLPPVTGDWIIDLNYTWQNETINILGDVIVRNGNTVLFDNITLNCNNIIVETGAVLNITDDTVYCQNVAVQQGGALNIDPSNIYQSGQIWVDGFYHLDDTWLFMNCSYNGQYNITVNSTGSFNMTANSWVVENQTANYLIFVNNGASFRVENSHIQDCGWDSNNVGLWVDTDFAYLNNATLAWNYNGITLNSSTGTELTNCNISDNVNYGILLNDSDANTITGGTFFNNNGGICLQWSDTNLIWYANYSDNTNYGMIFVQSRTNTVINCSIWNSAQDIHMDDNGQISLINCTLNYSNIFYGDALSQVEVKWYLDVYVTDDGGQPLEGAQVNVYDNGSAFIFNGVTTASGHCMFIVCTQYVENSSGYVGIETPHNVTVNAMGYEIAWLEPGADMTTSKTVNVQTARTITYKMSGFYISEAYNAGYPAYWLYLEWHEYLPLGTDIDIETRTGNSDTPDDTWSAWSSSLSTLTGSGITSPDRTRYMQYRVSMTTTNNTKTPVFYDMTVHYSSSPSWAQTGKADFDAGALDETNTTASPGNVILNKTAGNYEPWGNWTSQSYDGGEGLANWNQLYWDIATPPATAITFFTRTSNTSNMGDPSPWAQVNSPISSPGRRYIQARAQFQSGNPAVTPILGGIIITANSNILQDTGGNDLVITVWWPNVDAYDFRDSTDVSRLNQQVDVEDQYYFYIAAHHYSGWDVVDFIDIKGWYDFGNDASVYNSTAGGNYNFHIRYENSTATGNVATYTLMWPLGGEITGLSGNDIIDNSTNHRLFFNFSLGSQIRFAPGNGAWTNGPGYNDLNSWNFNISVKEGGVGGTTVDVVEDEFGIYRFVNISALNSPSGNGRPGQLVTLSPRQYVNSSSNYQFKLNASIGNLTGGAGQIHANYVNVTYSNVTGPAVWSGWQPFITETGVNNWTVFMHGTVGGYHTSWADGTSTMTMADWRVSIPMAQAEGSYTSDITYRISANPA
jgi:parallel beta-helix repeat protein